MYLNRGCQTHFCSIRCWWASSLRVSGAKYPGPRSHFSSLAKLKRPGSWSGVRGQLGAPLCSGQHGLQFPGCCHRHHCGNLDEVHQRATKLWTCWRSREREAQLLLGDLNPLLNRHLLHLESLFEQSVRDSGSRDTTQNKPWRAGWRPRAALLLLSNTFVVLSLR